MDLNRGHWRDFYVIRSGEGPRGLYVSFDHENFSVGDCVVDNLGFKCEIGANGQCNVGLSCRQLSGVNCVANISKHLGNDFFWSGDRKIILRSSFYSTLGSLVDEIKLQEPTAVSFEWDHLGYCHYTGTDHLYIPSEFKNDFLEDSIAHKFGFQSAEIETFEGINCYKVAPGFLGKDLGDLFGPLTDVIVTCDQLSPSETSQVLTVVPLQTHSTRCAFAYNPIPNFSPLNNEAIFKLFRFRLFDKLMRPAHFLCNPPSALVQIMPL